MSAATASVADVSRGDLIRNNSWEPSNAGGSHNQCSPFPLPSLGTQRIIQGNGTNVGTVISLQCPALHQLVGSELKCIMSSNTTKWVGAPYCKPLSSDFGFRVAVMASTVSSAIILVLSVAFITCCWLDCLKESDRKQKERELELWQWDESAPHQEVRRPRQGHKSRNNNNNNSQEQTLSSVFCDGAASCRYEPTSLRSLPGHEQVLMTQNISATASNFRPPPSYYRSSGGLHADAVWQYEPGRDPRTKSAVRSSKDFSIRIISV